MSVKVSQPAQHSDEVRLMFTRIASRYDLLNRVMTLGRDRHWRRETIRRLELAPSDRLLDVGSGTGDLAHEASRQQGDSQIIACDFTPAMLKVGRKRHDNHGIHWVVADARALPFADQTFDAVVSGFLLRNVADLDQTLAEQARILINEGRIASLDTTPPQANLLHPLLTIYLRWVIPALGRWFAGDVQAYRYLPETTRAFLEAQRLADVFQANGFKDVKFIRRMLGTIAIHWGRKATNADRSHSSSLTTMNGS